MVDTFAIGPHTPRMKPEDVSLVHRLWLATTKERGLDSVHHHDIVTLALTRYARDYAGHDREEILRELRKLERGGPRGQGDASPADRDKEHPPEPPSPPVLGPS